MSATLAPMLRSTALHRTRPSGSTTARSLYSGRVAATRAMVREHSADAVPDEAWRTAALSPSPTISRRVPSISAFWLLEATIASWRTVVQPRASASL